MTQVHSFAPISDAAAKILILGSMPGKASLKAKEYYAHPRNAFWRIMEHIFGIDPGLPYLERCSRLADNHVAVWDALKTCTRSGSLDSDIIESSIVPNDFQWFYSTHTQVDAVYFNGAKAAHVYLKHVLPELPETMASMPAVRLPSTSPAHASLSLAGKLERWTVLLR